MKIINRSVLYFFFLLIGACVSYTDPIVKDLDKSQYAIVLIDISIKVEEINERRVPLNWLAPIDKLSLPPGEHTFKIVWDNVNIRTKSITMKQYLEPGKTYNLIRTVNNKNSTWSFQFNEQL